MADDISIGIKVTGGEHDIVKVAKATVTLLDSNVKLLSPRNV